MYPCPMMMTTTVVMMLRYAKPNHLWHSDRMRTEEACAAEARYGASRGMRRP